MNRRVFLQSTAGAALLGPEPAQAYGAAAQTENSTPQRPNIVLLMADQHRHDALGCAGNELIRTPNLDRLATTGVRFTHALTPTPVCVAARMSLITGQRASRTHWVHNSKLPGPAPALPSLMDVLAEAGYHTHAVGKMHFGGRHYGLHGHESMEEAVKYRIDDDYLTYLHDHGIRTRYPQGLRDLLYFQPQTSGIPLEHAQNSWVAERAVAFLRRQVRHRATKPFFLWASWIAPHPPFAPCEPYDSLYEPDAMPLPVYADRPFGTLPSPVWIHRARLEEAHLDPARIRRLRALYYGQISHVDHGVGRVLEELVKLGMAENTVVVYLSDHGEMMGDHGLSQKNVPYEPSVRVPLLLRWPGRTEAGRVCDDLVGLTDLLPTLLDGIGLQYPGGATPLTGQSLLNVAGGGLSGRDAYVSDYGHGGSRWISVRTKAHKYALWAAGGYEELYDLEADPHEQNNLAEKQPGLAGEMRSRLLRWEHDHGLASSFQGRQFRVYEEPLTPAQTPREVVINEGPWPLNLPLDERQTVESYAAAFDRAISKERTLSPEKLSLKQYKERGGTPLTGTRWEEVWKNA